MTKALILLLAIIVSTAAFAALHFPALTGRVVDDAHVLSPGAVRSLEQKLAGYEAGTTNQVVVATLPSLQGDSIEDFSNELYRHWALGQKGKDNGVLLVVVPSERRICIEVGYGLEGTLTDALSSEIINGVIAPDFRRGDFQKGIMNGTDAILTALGGRSIAMQAEPQPQSSVTDSPIFGFIVLAFFLFFAIRYPTATWLLMSSVRVGGSSSGGWGGGGFSGGGGSSGGGGASGSW